MKLKYLAFLPALVLVATPIFAREATPSATRKPERADDRCRIVSQRLGQTIKNYETRRDLHIKEYQRLHDRLVVVAGNLSAKGIDTSQLTSDLATLNTMIANLTTSYQAFINNLTTSRADACTLSMDEIRLALSDSRTQLQTFRQTSKTIHDFIQNTIRKDLQSLRGNK